MEINGVGYRAAVEGKDLVLSLGFSHPVRYPIPDGVTMKCERPTAITIHGGDKQKVGQLAAEIRAYRPPEPFKGKGIKYAAKILEEKKVRKSKGSIMLKSKELFLKRRAVIDKHYEKKRNQAAFICIPFV